MVYVGTPPSTRGYGERCRAYIDPALPVMPHGVNKTGEGMPYWPGYSSIPPVCRATYLDWLADGARDPSYNPGYMFLYFYGLERRFLQDHPPLEEQREILEEVRRLAALYPDNGSVQRYLGAFIQVAQVAVDDSALATPLLDHRGWDIPFSVKVALGRMLEREERIPSDWLLCWLVCHPEGVVRTPAKRCLDEFRALFQLRFDAKYPDGLKVNKPKRTLKESYQAASGEFQVGITPEINGTPIPDISALRKPVTIAQEIADGATEELDKLSRYLGRHPDGRGSLEAHALLPTDLRELFPSEDLERLKTWAREQVAQGGLVPITEVIGQLEGEPPEKLTKRNLTSAADALARIGFGLAPDPRFALRAPKIDEPAVLFDLGQAVERLEDVSPTYPGALIELALGAFIAHADGHIADLERETLARRIEETAGLTDQERRRLMANLHWLLAVPPDMALLRRKLKETGPDSQAALRAALVSAAHADGMVQAEEVASIEKVYKALGLDPNLAYSDLHAGDVPVTVRAARPGPPGEAIPAERPQTQTLDTARIAAIRADTERVSSVLGEIFSGDQGEDEETATIPVPSALTGLDPKHAALVRDLIAQDHWSEDAFSDLCGRHGLLASGALEVVNEWAFDTHDEALLDEYDGYDVAADIAAALKGDFEKGNPHVQA
jgi:tellurite resistance protein